MFITEMAIAITEFAREACQGRLVFVLEGSYDPRVVAHGAIAILHGLSSLKYAEDLLGAPPYAEPAIDSLLGQLRTIHSIS
jgi:acetoin utilization deacetylase AcuC-like enzyme